MVGTPYFMAPEITESTRYSFSSDVFSLGLLMYNLCTLELPFDKRTTSGQHLQVRHLTDPGREGSSGALVQRFVGGACNPWLAMLIIAVSARPAVKYSRAHT